MRLLELFSGTGSVGKVFREQGWEVVSLDCDPKFSANIVEDIRQWDYKSYPPDYFSCIWASPMCTQYSRARTTAKTPRNLVEADSLVQSALAVINYFSCPYFLENPQSRLLKSRPFMQNLPYQDVTYCSYGYKCQKKTRIWTTAAWLPSRAFCKMSTCPAVVDGRHLQSAQQGPARNGKQGRRRDDNNNLHELYSIPAALVLELCNFVSRDQSTIEA